VSELAVESDWLRPLSLEEYHRLIDEGFFDEDEHLELLEGHLVATSPQSPLHAWILRVLTEVFVPVFGQGGAVRVQMPLTLRKSEPEPDFAIVDAVLERTCPRHPPTARLVVEVAGPDSLKKDRTLKAALYAEAGVDEYWVVHAEKEIVEVFLDPDPIARTYASISPHRRDDTLRPRVLPATTIPVAKLFDRG
jgi:Uma2 family endonuclease